MADEVRAFPERCSEGYDKNGMDLRDWFAGQALKGLIGAMQLKKEDIADLANRFAVSSYKLADAMIEARKDK